jgi:hypothetical protein
VGGSATFTANYKETLSTEYETNVGGYFSYCGVPEFEMYMADQGTLFGSSMADYASYNYLSWSYTGYSATVTASTSDET